MLGVICLSGFLWFTQNVSTKTKDITLKGYDWAPVYPSATD